MSDERKATTMTDRSKTLWTFAITSIALFMVSLDNLVVSTAIPVIRTDLNASLEDLSWTVNAYTLTFAVLLLTGAALGDRFGRSNRNPRSVEIRRAVALKKVCLLHHAERCFKHVHGAPDWYCRVAP